MQFTIIAYDYKDDKALSRRLKARKDHIALWDKLKFQWNALYWVALLDQKNQMNGSIYIVDFLSRKELDKWLKVEPYVTGKVWEKIDIIPCKVWPSFVNK